ncbi:serine/threonine-protein phosphatase with EF-hands 1 isoform X4 [Dendropsophus ebraccatus]
MQKYKIHAKSILHLLEDIYSRLPLATIIDGKVLILHGGIADTTDLDFLTSIERSKYKSALKHPRSDSERSNLIQKGGLQAEFSNSAILEIHYMDSSNRLPDMAPELTVTEQKEWKQLVDILWSDPRNQNGCSPNSFRGGGCYFGPDITKKLLDQYDLKMLIRSHECKQEGYEIGHNGRVITIFSASNYYDEGSNRGAYLKLCPDLIPRFVQYQVSKSTRKLTLHQRMSAVEDSALRALQEQFFAHRSDLIEAFREYDPDGTGRICISEWASAMEAVLHLDLPWRTLRSRLVQLAPDGSVEYLSCFEHLQIEKTIKEVQPSLVETLYRYKADLEIIFNIIDKDHSVSSAATCLALGQLENGRTFFRYGGIYASFACNPGFSLLGHVSSTCIQGRWRKPLPVCIASGCHMPTGIVHGSLKTSHNNAVITVTCKNGYKLFGSPLIYCNGKKWNSTIPICRETDMMLSSSQKMTSETERTFVVGNPASKRVQIKVSFNATQKGHDRSEIVSINKTITAPRKENDLKNTMSSYHGQQLQREQQSTKTFLSFGDEKNRSQQSSKRLKSARITATTENVTPPNLIKLVTSGYSLYSSVSQMRNSKITQEINQTSRIRANLYLTEWYYSTPGSSGFTDTQTKHPQLVKHDKMSTSLSVDSSSYPRTTTPQQTTQQVQSTLLEKKIPTNSNGNSYLSTVLVAAQTIPPLTKPYNDTAQMMTNTPNFLEDNHKYEGNATTTARMATNITSLFIYYNHTSPVQVPTTKTPIVEMANVFVNTTDQENFITGHRVTSTYPGYKVTFVQSRILSNVKAPSTPALPGSTSTITAITSNFRRNHKNFGILKRTFIRRFQCVYPPLPNHGTFRFLTIRDPLPNQYPYYIQYSCYPGYTMSTGDVYSFCKDNGEWSGLVPVCED